MGKRIRSYRFYWKQPRLMSQLSEEQRKKVTEKFFKVVEKSEEENARRMSKIMKERNERLPLPHR